MSSVISIDELIHHSKDNKQTHVALIDINTMFGTMEFYQKAKANNLTPIIGLQINYQNETLVLVAKDYAGYKNLLKISSYTCTNTTFDINKYFSSLFVITHSQHPLKFLKSNKDVYSTNSHSDNVIAVQECFFRNKADVRLLKALLAIKGNQQLSDYDNNHEFDGKYMLSNNEAQKVFSTRALQNLEVLVNACK
jgi:DNA polymerase-3 subunit alpha